MDEFKENEPYIFVSYSHKDENVLDIIKRLKELKLRIWYDDNIFGGSEWDDNIAEHIKNCHIFCAFISHSYSDSRNCNDELKYALNKEKDVHIIYLEELELSEGLKMRLDRVQALFGYKYDNTILIEKLLQNKNVEECREASNIKPDSWGPQDRKTFQRDNLPDYPVFNSVVDDETIGDQRNFVRIRKNGSGNTFGDYVDAEVGALYEVRIYYENNANAQTNESGQGIARNVCIRTSFPKYLKSGEQGAICGEVVSSNANPHKVYDHVFIGTRDNVYINYVPNSAVLNNTGTSNGTKMNGEALCDSGVSLSYYDTMWGMLPGGEKYKGTLTYYIKVDKPLFKVHAQVSTDGSNWYDELTACPRDVLNFRLTMVNIGTTELNGVTAHAIHNKELKYINKTTYARSTRHPQFSASPDSLNKDGLRLGSIIPDEEVVVEYKAQINDSVKENSVICDYPFLATNFGEEYARIKININIK